MISLPYFNLSFLFALDYSLAISDSTKNSILRQKGVELALTGLSLAVKSLVHHALCMTLAISTQDT